MQLSHVNTCHQGLFAAHRLMNKDNKSITLNEIQFNLVDY